MTSVHMRRAIYARLKVSVLCENLTPGKSFGIAADAAMPKDLPLWAELNRKIDALRLRSDRQPTGLSKLASLDNTGEVSRLQPFSASLRKPENSTLFIPHSPTGTITDSAPKVQYEPCPSNTAT